MKKIVSLLMITISVSLLSQITITEMPIDTSDDLVPQFLRDGAVPPVLLAPEGGEIVPPDFSEQTIKVLKKFDASKYLESYSKKGSRSTIFQIARSDNLNTMILDMVKSVEENYRENDVYISLVAKLEQNNTDLTKQEIQLLLEISSQHRASETQSYKPEVVDEEENLKELKPKNTGSNHSGSRTTNE